ncbi:protein FATTY ACID EXPORT 3, chloroplastic [Magnolia sinica]|uniref:protein FATTY ACID EXPORT 3, chloroplastic n=1 Tax=Magnolia sinica TaxID=86752 RepID=UPI0026587FFE|nr:protein FATTY ACID EXPORT 3, chloroplastic [Magnolia sinica]
MKALHASHIFSLQRPYLPRSIRAVRFLHPSHPSVAPKGLGLRYLALDPRRRPGFYLSRPIAASAASHKEEPHTEIEVEKGNGEVKTNTEESQEEWEKTLESFKEQALKMQAVSKEAYEVYSEKAMIILMETSKQLKIQAEKTRHDLAVVAKEISEESKEYLSAAAENSPEPVKDIVETFTSSSDELKEVSEVRDFYLGIPYGALLSIGGFLSFMLTGSISAIRFGVILGGALLALSISSLRSWKHGEASAPFLKGQAAIAVIIFIRELRLLCQRPSFPTSFMTLISGGMVVFYLYRIGLSGLDGHKGGPSAEQIPEN